MELTWNWNLDQYLYQWKKQSKTDKLLVLYLLTAQLL